MRGRFGGAGARGQCAAAALIRPLGFTVRPPDLMRSNT